MHRTQWRRGLGTTVPNAAVLGAPLRFPLGANGRFLVNGQRGWSVMFPVALRQPWIF